MSGVESEVKSGATPGVRLAILRDMDTRPEMEVRVAGEVAPPELTPGAARVLLRILRKDVERRVTEAASPGFDPREVLAS